MAQSEEVNGKICCWNSQKKEGVQVYGFASLNKDMFCHFQFTQIHHSLMYPGKHFADLHNSMKSHLSFSEAQKNWAKNDVRWSLLNKWAVYYFAKLSGPRGRQLGGTAAYTGSLKLTGKSEKLVLVVTIGPWRHEVLGSDPESVG